MINLHKILILKSLTDNIKQIFIDFDIRIYSEARVKNGYIRILAGSDKWLQLLGELVI